MLSIFAEYYFDKKNWKKILNLFKNRRFNFFHKNNF